MKQKSQASLITKFALLIVIMVLLVLYFWGHNVEQSARNLAHGFMLILKSTIAIGRVGLLVAVSGGIGRVILRKLLNIILYHEVSKAEGVAIDAGLGLGMVSCFALSLGLFGIYNNIIWLILIIFGVINLVNTGRWILDFFAVIRSAFQTETAWQRFIMIFASGLLIAAFLLALAPPFAWDAMTYHLEGANRYVQAGRIAAQPDNFFFGFPQLVEVLYGLLMLPLNWFMIPIESDSAPAVLHFTFGIFGLMATAGLTRRYTDKNTAYTSILLLLSSYSIWLLFGWPYVDLAMLCFGVLALIAITQWHTEKNIKWLIICGLIAGFALGTKYTAASLIIGLGVFILSREPKQVIRNGFIFGLSLFVAFLPWMIKGILLYQNPVYPYVFGGLNWDSLRAANFGSSGNGLISGNLWWNLPILPFAATIFGQEKISPYAFTTGAWLLTLPFALIFGWKALDDKARSLAKNLLPIALVLLGFWMFLAATSGIGAQPRLMMVGMPIAAILGAIGLHSIAKLPRKPLDIYFIVQAVIIFSVLIGLFDVGHEFAKTRVLDYTAGTLSEQQYLTQNLGYYYQMTQQLETLPADSTVLFLFQPWSYYCPDTLHCLPDALFDNWARPLQLGATADEVMHQWQIDGVDYILLDTNSYDFWLNQHEEANEANSQLLDNLNLYLTPIWEDNIQFALYEWNDN